MKRIILGLVGPIASGKGVVSDYLSENGYVFEKLSDRLREEVTNRGLELTRNNLQDVGNELRRINGNQILAELTLNKYRDVNSSICIDGVRNPGEVEYIKKKGGYIIAITAPPEIRLWRYLKRAEERGEDGSTVEAFNIANNRDLGVGESANGQQVSQCISLSDFTVENIGSKEDLIKEIKKILKQIP